jgi:chromosome segregation ATPase
MPKVIGLVPTVAILLAGVAAGTVVFSRKAAGRGSDLESTDPLREALGDLDNRLAAQKSATASRFAQLEMRLDEHASKLAQVPTMGQVVQAMEQVLAKTIASLDERLTTQAQSIEVLKNTLSQTDSLLERVLESLDSLRTTEE